MPVAPPENEPEHSAVRWDGDANGWLVRSWSACRSIARDDGRRWQKVFRPGLSEPDLIEIWGAGSASGITYVPSGATANPPETAVHRWWMRALCPEAVEPHRAATIRPIVDRALGRLDGRGRADLDAELAQWIPIRVIAAIMGLPGDAGFLDECRRLVLAATAVRGMATGEQGVVPAQSTAASVELRELLLPFVRSRRDGAGTDFISDLWRHAPQIFEPGWDELTIVANVRIMFQPAPAPPPTAWPTCCTSCSPARTCGPPSRRGRRSRSRRWSRSRSACTARSTRRCGVRPSTSSWRGPRSVAAAWPCCSTRTRHRRRGTRVAR